jgi:hypothetical protein
MSQRRTARGHHDALCDCTASIPNGDGGRIQMHVHSDVPHVVMVRAQTRSCEWVTISVRHLKRSYALSRRIWLTAQ